MNNKPVGDYLTSNTELTPLELLKALGCLAMTLVHCFTFFVRRFPQENFLFSTPSFTPFHFLLGFYALSLPALAGIMLRERLSPFLVDGSLKGVFLKRVYFSLALLGVLEFFKNGILFGFQNALRWDTLHLIAASLILILFFLKKWGLDSLKLLVIVVLTYLLINTPHDIRTRLLEFYQQLLGQKQLMYMLSLAVLLFFPAVLILNSALASRVQTLLFITLLLLFMTLVFAIHSGTNSVLLTSFSSLGLSAFVPAEVGGHIWHLTPWLILPLGAFLLEDFKIKRLKNEKKLFYFALAFHVGFILIFFFLLEPYYSAFKAQEFLTARFFNPGLLNPLFILFFLTAAYASFLVLVKLIKIKSQALKELADALMVFYFVHFLLASKLLLPLSFIFKGKVLLFAYIGLVFLLSYLISVGISFFLNKRIFISLRKT